MIGYIVVFILGFIVGAFIVSWLWHEADQERVKEEDFIWGRHENSKGRRL